MNSIFGYLFPLLLTCASCAQVQKDPSGTFLEKHLSTVPKDCVFDGSATFASNGRSVAYIVNCNDAEYQSHPDDGPMRVIFRNEKGPLFHQIAGTWGLEVSGDGLHVGYSASKTKDFRAVVDTTIVEWGSGFPHFSPDSSTVAYWQRDDRGHRLIVGAKVIAESKDPLQFLSFSPDGKRVAYLASRFIEWPPGKSSPEYRQVLMIDGLQVSEEHCDIRGFHFSPRGNSFAYIGYEDPFMRIQRLVVGDKKGPEFHWIGNFSFSPDGQRVAYSASNGKRTSVYIGENDIAPEFDDASDPVFTPDGSQVVFLGGVGKKSYVVMGDHRWELHGGKSWQPLVVSPDGHRVAYVASAEGGGHHIVVGDQIGEVSDGICTPPIFSPDSKKIAYGARNGREFWWKVLNISDN